VVRLHRSVPWCNMFDDPKPNEIVSLNLNLILTVEMFGEFRKRVLEVQGADHRLDMEQFISKLVHKDLRIEKERKRI